MRGAMLFAAGLFVGVAVHVGLAQRASSGGAADGVVMMNHVAINVPNIDEAVTYYTQKMGYREAFRANDDKGQVRLVYMHISNNTFLELQPVTPQRAAGFNHYGLQVENVAEAVARFRKNGLTVSDANRSDTKAMSGEHHRSVHGAHRARGIAGLTRCTTKRSRGGRDGPQAHAHVLRHAHARACRSTVPRCSCGWRVACPPRAAARWHAADRPQPPVNSGANPYRVIRDWAQLDCGESSVGRLERRRHR